MTATNEIERRLSCALSSAEHSLCVSVYGSTVRIAGPAAQLDRLRRFYTPYYELRHDSADDVDVEIVVCAERHNHDRTRTITDMRVFLRASKPTVVAERFACFSRPVTGIEVICDRASGRILLNGGLATEVALQGRTLVRDQVFRQIEKPKGSVVFHASAIELEGMGVAFVGARNSGKTASLLAFLSKRKANLVSGDRVKLWAADSKTITMAGTPARCNIHRVALKCDPLLQPIAGNSVRYDREGKALVDAKSIVQLAGVKLLPAARLDVVVFPEILPNREPIRVERLTDSEEVKQLMRHNVIEGTRKDRHVHWLGLIPDPPITLAERIEHILERMGRIVFVRVSGGYESYVKAIEDGSFDPLTPVRRGSPRKTQARAEGVLSPCRVLHSP